MNEELIERLPAKARPVLRKAVAGGRRAMGNLGLPGLARGKHSTSAMDQLEQDVNGTADFGASFTVTEPAPALDLAYASQAALRPRPVSTFHLVADTDDPRWSFQHNVMVAGDGRVLTEERIAFDALDISRARLARPRRVRGTVAYLSNTDVANFGHWVSFVFPLLSVYRQRLGLEPDYYYLGGPLKAHHVETLARVGIEPDQVLTDPVCADRLVAVIANRRWGRIDPSFLAYSRDHIGVGDPPAPGSRRLLVGRGNVRFRRFLNEEECLALLRDRYGFEHVTMDGLTVADEVKLFGEAECVVGVHGAALINMLWAPRGTRFVELMPFGGRSEDIMDVAAFIGAPYARVAGKDPRGSRAAAEMEANLLRRIDVLIDIDELDTAVRAVGLEPAG